MNISSSFFSRSVVLALALVLTLPLSVAAAPVTPGSIDPMSLTTRSVNPTISGTSADSKALKIVIREMGTEKIIYTGTDIRITKGAWHARITKNLLNGLYAVEVAPAKDAKPETTLRGVLAIGIMAPPVAPPLALIPVQPTASTTLVISSVPLLFGGVARIGTAAPVAYLQVTNVGKAPALVNGFWIKQNGSAPTQSIIGLSTVDDQGGSRGSVGGMEGSVLFKDGQAFAPTAATLAPGQMRLFTIKALLTNSAYAALGTLAIDVVGIDSTASAKAVFPIRGTTWTLSR
ncbi:MAG TPA: hypothetical protein VM103_02675 [Candidatus Paceibacterota bacterium]|nr:hypothetical protein [Candidatus Paceibacterota bacterium]